MQDPASERGPLPFAEVLYTGALGVRETLRNDASRMFNGTIERTHKHNYLYLFLDLFVERSMTATAFLQHVANARSRGSPLECWPRLSGPLVPERNDLLAMCLAAGEIAHRDGKAPCLRYKDCSTQCSCSP